MTNAPRLSIVSSISKAAYPYSVSLAIAPPLNSVSVQTAQMIVKGAINTTGMSDYKMLTEFDRVVAHFPTKEDHDDYLEALRPGAKLSKVYSYSSNWAPPKTVIQCCKIVEKGLNDMFAGELRVTPNITYSTIRLSGYKASFFAAKRVDPIALIFGRSPG